MGATNFREVKMWYSPPVAKQTCTSGGSTTTWLHHFMLLIKQSLLATNFKNTDCTGIRPCIVNFVFLVSVVGSSTNLFVLQQRIDVADRTYPAFFRLLCPGLTVLECEFLPHYPFCGRTLQGLRCASEPTMRFKAIRIGWDTLTRTEVNPAFSPWRLERTYSDEATSLTGAEDVKARVSPHPAKASIRLLHQFG